MHVPSYSKHLDMVIESNLRYLKKCFIPFKRIKKPNIQNRYIQKSDFKHFNKLLSSTLLNEPLTIKRGLYFLWTITPIEKSKIWSTTRYLFTDLKIQYFHNGYLVLLLLSQEYKIFPYILQKKFIDNHPH